MILIKRIEVSEKKLIKQIVQIHLKTFPGFFLTFMGKGFLNQMYACYCSHPASGLYVAFDEEKPVGFLAFSSDFSGLYKYMIKHKLFAFMWYSIGAFFRKPKVFLRLVRALLKPGEAKRKEDYVELSSIGVAPEQKGKGIGSLLIDKLKEDTDFTKFTYINLETDAENNEAANRFYQKNGFKLFRTYQTREGREMNEYRYTEKDPIS
ncbi:MAG: GNAT family N-acetyltransferase [Ruminococcaceae bacterium]|nr:GNAT family N-acetyltransferase [Oscillospiraceae bacterium]